MVEPKMRYKLYKHKKQWVVGCSAVILSMAFGATNVHASTSDAKTAAADASQVEVTNASNTEPTSPLTFNNNSTTSTDPTSNSQQKTPNEKSTPSSTPTTNTGTSTPVTTPTNTETTRVPQHYGVRNIKIDYPSYINGSSTGTQVEDTIIQEAVNGKWEALDWTPPEGTFQGGVQGVPVHIDAQDATEAPEQLYVNYVFRIVDIPTTKGNKQLSQSIVIIRGLPNGQTFHLPDLNITSDIKAPYYPYMKYPDSYGDDIIERDGQYFLTGATITATDATSNFIYHGNHSSQEGSGVTVIRPSIGYQASFTIKFVDYNGKAYSSDTIYKNIGNIQYGDSFDSFSISQQAVNYYYNNIRPTNHNVQLLGGFYVPNTNGIGGHIVNDITSLADAYADNDSFTFCPVLVQPVYKAVPNTKTTKTRKIILNKPTGQETILQTVTLQEFAIYDDITGDELPDNTIANTVKAWKVLIGNDPQNNNSWETINGDNNSWASYQVPDVPGYTPSMSEIGEASDITSNTQDTTVTVNYTANDQQQVINYVNESGAVISSTTLSGKTDQTISITPQAPDHYVIKSGQMIPDSVTLSTTNPAINIIVVPKIDDITDLSQLNKTLSRTITINIPGKAPQVITQTATFTRTGQVNEVTGQSTYTAWQLQKNGLASVDVPVVTGYTPSQSTIEGITNPTANMQLKDITVNYTANDEVTHIIYQDPAGQIIHTTTINGKFGQTVPVINELPTGWELVPGQSIPTAITFDNPNMTDIIIKIQRQPSNDKPGRPNHSESAVTSSQNGSNSQRETNPNFHQPANISIEHQTGNTLPQTGNDTSALSALGLMSLSFAGMLGLYGARKKQD